MTFQRTATSTAAFEIYPSGNEYRWRLKGANGEIVAHGESYTTRASVRRAVEAVQRLAPTAAVKETY
jgi:uncharacterized protein YegP (UPF0339 family)